MKRLLSLLLVGAMLVWHVPMIQAQDNQGASPRWKAPRQVFADMEPLTSDGSVRVTLDTHQMWLFDAAVGMWKLIGGGAGLNWLVPVNNTWDPTGGLPVAPVAGDRYIATATATGWTIDHVYTWTGAAWTDYGPATNDAVYNNASTVTSIYDGTTWRGFGMTGTWLGLLDTPFTYVGKQWYLNKVNGGETALIYTILKENATGDLTIGNGLAGHDYTITVDGATNDLVMTWLQATNTLQIDSVLSMNTHQIKNVVDPSANQDAATKYYVDTMTHGLLWLEPIINFYDPTPGLPGAPLVGDRYCATATANGWTKDHIYECVTGGTWVGATDTTPVNGNAFYDNGDAKAYVWYVPSGGSGSWVTFGSIMLHNALGGLQGGLVVGGTDEYYHLSATEYHNLRDNMAFADKGVFFSDAGKLQVDATKFAYLKTVGAASGTQSVLTLAPTVAQSGTAGYNALFVNVTESSVGSGVKNLVDLQMGSASKFRVDDTGYGVFANNIWVQGANGVQIGYDSIPTVANVPGYLFMQSAGDNAFYNSFISGTNTASATYTLPTAMPTVAGQVLGSTLAGVMSWESGGSIPAPGSDKYVIFNDAGLFGADSAFQFDKTINAASGTESVLALTSSIAQSGTAGYTALIVNLTESSVGSGDKNLIDLQVGSASKFKVTNAGYTTAVKYVNASIISLTDGDTTPSIVGGNVFLTANTGVTSITNFDDGVTSQRITVIFGDANTTVVYDPTKIYLNGDANFTGQVGDSMTLTRDASNIWHEAARGGPSGLTGVGAAGEVTYWTAPAIIAGDTSFLYSPTTHEFSDTDGSATAYLMSGIKSWVEHTGNVAGFMSGTAALYVEQGNLYYGAYLATNTDHYASIDRAVTVAKLNKAPAIDGNGGGIAFEIEAERGCITTGAIDSVLTDWLPETENADLSFKTLVGPALTESFRIDGSDNANIDVLTHKIHNVGTPVANADAVTKLYVDTVAYGAIGNQYDIQIKNGVGKLYGSDDLMFYYPAIAGVGGQLFIPRGFINFYQLNDTPIAAPTVAVNATAGSLNGVYKYKIGFSTGGGSSMCGPESLTVNPVNEKVDLSNIPVSSSSNCKGRTIYRTMPGGSVFYYAGNIGDNTTTTYTDNWPDPWLFDVEPIVDATAGAYTGSAMLWTDVSGYVNVGGGLILGTYKWGGSNNVPGYLKLWSAGTTNYYTTFTAGDQTAYAGNINYILPIAPPTASGQSLTATTAGVMSWASGGSIPAPGSDKYMIFNDSGVFGADAALQFDKTINAASGVENIIALTSAVAQSGTAGYNALFVNVTESSVGSGAKNLIDLQVGSSSKFKVDDTGVTTAVAYLPSAITTLTDNSATPSVSGHNEFAASNSNPTTITNLTNGTPGQNIEIYATNANTTLQNNANIELSTGSNYAMGTNATIRFLYDGTMWHEVGRGGSGSGTVTGSSESPRVAVWTGTSSIAGYAGYTFTSGTSTLVVGVHNTQAGVLRLNGAGSSFNKYVSLTPSASQTGDTAYTLPIALAAVTNQPLVSTTAGVMSWGTDLVFPLGGNRSISVEATTGNGHNLDVHAGDGTATCFAAGTKVSMADGTVKAIEKIKGGDSVKAFDDQGKVVSSKVTKIFSHTPSEMTGSYYLLVRTSDLTEMKVTVNHPIYIKGIGYKEASNLRAGDELLKADSKTVTVFSVARAYSRIPTYNIEVDAYHNYFAEGILVHNKITNAGDLNLYAGSNSSYGGNVHIYGGTGTAGSGTVCLAYTGGGAQGTVSIGSGASSSLLSVGSASQLTVDTSGNIGTTGTATFQNAAGVEIGKDVAGGTPNVAGLIKLWSAGDNAYYTTITTPTQTQAAIAYTLPIDDGTSNQFLQTNGSGVLSWTTALTSASTLQAVTTAGATTNVSTLFQNAAAIELGKDDATNVAGSMKLWGAGANNYYTTFTTTTQTQNVDYLLPPDDGTSGQFLQTNGTGTLTWQTAAGGVTYAVSDKTNDYNVLTTDLGSGTTFTMYDASNEKKFNLPVITTELGKPITFVKKGAGKVTIQANTGQKIADSGAGDTIYDDQISETYATITLEAITTTQWVIVGADGTWVTTD